MVQGIRNFICRMLGLPPFPELVRRLHRTARDASENGYTNITARIQEQVRIEVAHMFNHRWALAEQECIKTWDGEAVGAVEAYMKANFDDAEFLTALVKRLNELQLRGQANA